LETYREALERRQEGKAGMERVIRTMDGRSWECPWGCIWGYWR